MLNKKKNNKGFTLVELLVVIAIMGILAVVAVPSLFKNIEKAKVAEATSYINSYKTAAISVYADKGSITSGGEIETQVEGKKPDTLGTITPVISADGILIEVTVTDAKVKTSLGEKFSADTSIEIK